MPTTKNNTIYSLSEDARDWQSCLRFAHNRIVPAMMDEGQWTEGMMLLGDEFARGFCRLYPEGEQEPYRQKLTGSKKYWDWWRFAYMRDDHGYINQKVSAMGIGYAQYKAYMLNCEHLEEELISLINSTQLCN